MTRVPRPGPEHIGKLTYRHDGYTLKVFLRYDRHCLIIGSNPKTSDERNSVLIYKDELLSGTLAKLVLDVTCKRVQLEYVGKAGGVCSVNGVQLGVVSAAAGAPTNCQIL